MPKTPLRALVALALLAAALGATACGPIIEAAPFRVGPDTALPGELLGPFDGQVLDGDSDRPVPGALVYACWTFERGTGFVGPDGAASRTAETDGAGRYQIARLSDLPGGLSTRIVSFTLLVYKPGFVGYRSDRLFRGLAPRTDFAQRANLVRLERFGENVSHARHLAFIAGAPQVRKAALWEVELASLELEREPKTPARGAAEATPPTLLDVGPLLTLADVRAITHFTGAFEEERLGDYPHTSFYDSHHFRATGQPERFDIALRVWKLPPTEAKAQYAKLVQTLPGALPTSDLGERSTRAGDKEILGLAWQDDHLSVVVQLTCGRAQCPDHSRLVEMGKLIEQRLGEPAKSPASPESTKLRPPSLAPAPAPAPSKTPAPEPTPQQPPGPLKLKPPGVIK